MRSIRGGSQKTLSPKKPAQHALALARVAHMLSGWQRTPAAQQSTPSPLSLPPSHPPPWFSDSLSSPPPSSIQLGGVSLCKAPEQVALCTPPQCSRRNPQTDQAAHRRTPLPPLASPTCWWPEQSTADLSYHPSMCSSGIISCSQLMSAFVLNRYYNARLRYFVHLMHSYQIK